MSKNISILESLIELIPTSPFSISLDNRKEEKNTLVLTESIGFKESEELVKSEKKTLFTTDIKDYIEVTEDKVDFNNILSLLKTFYENVRSYESMELKDYYIFQVNQTGLFGYLGREKNGNFCFTLNFRVKYYI